MRWKPKPARNKRFTFLPYQCTRCRDWLWFETVFAARESRWFRFHRLGRTSVMCIGCEVLPSLGGHFSKEEEQAAYSEYMKQLQQTAVPHHQIPYHTWPGPNTLPSGTFTGSGQAGVAWHLGNAGGLISSGNTVATDEAWWR